MLDLSGYKKSEIKPYEGKLFIISAPSGAGKTTLTAELMARCGRELSLERVITYTSRLPRSGEVDGVDYFFISEKEFQSRIKAGFFAEWSHVYGAYYGSARHTLEKLKEGVSLIIILDQQGACTLAKEYPSSVPIWIDPPSLESLKERLTVRATEALDHRDYRLKLAHGELLNADFLSMFRYRILNDDINKAADHLCFIIKSELLSPDCKRA
jgi:guanylate kinase